MPEALGLCFVVVIFGALAVAYLFADRAWRNQSTQAQQQATSNLAQLLSVAVTTCGEDTAKGLLQKAGRMPGVESVQWLTQTGTVRFAWPPTLSVVPGAGGADGKNGQDVCHVRVPVHTPDGQTDGAIAIVRAVQTNAEFQTALMWTWGVAAGLTLAVFALFYHRLRNHLRPMAAIQRNLQTYASGIERELATLTLSDSLGSSASAWNQLIGQLQQLSAQAESGTRSAESADVLARFEGAVFRRAVDRMPFGVLWVDDSGTVTYANAAAGGLLKFSPEALVGQDVATVIPNPAVVQAVVAVRGGSGAGRAVDDSEDDAAGGSTLRYRILAVTPETRGGDALVTIEDISQLREGERARDNFLYHVTHELRTPLTNIHAYAETLTQPDFDDEQTRKECYNVLISETQRLSRLVEDILSISQLEVGTARIDVGEVDLQRLVRQMVQDNLGTADEKKIDLTLSLPPKLPKVRGDKQRLSVLLNNLIGNGVKYTPEGGRVEVRVEVDEQNVFIRVADSGIGISEEDQQHVFEKFYRAADDQVQMVTGTGLGLALAREVARLHGGDITLESQLGEGSTFTIELPVGDAQQAEAGTQ